MRPALRATTTGAARPFSFALAALLLSGCAEPVPVFFVVVLLPGLVFLSSLLGAIVVLASTLFWLYAVDACVRLSRVRR